MTTSWQDSVKQSVDQELWQALSLKLDEGVEASIKQEGLIDNYYLPLFFHLYRLVQNQQTPLCIGINAPQGGGKSTLTGYLVQLFNFCELNAVTLSIDDFYLTREAQLQLAGANQHNSYLQQRGYPGTHDIELGIETITALKTPGLAKSHKLPRYDKSMHQGQGDRANKDLWPETPLPVDIVLLEGWMLGFQPISPEQVNDEQLIEINELLETYRSWHQLLDSFVYIYPEDPDYVVGWRIEAEERMKARGLPGMSADEVRNYAEKFLPAYRLYGPQLLATPPTPEPVLKIKVGKNRLPVTD